MGSKRFGGVLFVTKAGDHDPRHFHAFVGGGEVIVELTSDRRVILAERDDAVRSATASDVRKALSRAAQHLTPLQIFGRESMAKTKARVDVTKAEIDAAIARGKAFEQYAPRAIRATYRKNGDAIVITLSTGIEVAIPRGLLQGLKGANTRDVANVTILGPGSTLHWETLDVDHGLGGLLKGVFGNRQWMSEIGRRGGVARSPAKRAAARKNGRKGGRPRNRVAA